MTGWTVGERVQVLAGPRRRSGLWQIEAQPARRTVAAVSCATGARERLDLDHLDRAEHRTGALAVADLDPLAVVACGAAKLNRAAPAAELYTGSYFRAALAAARAMAGPRVLILSARHGLLDPSTVLDPYEQRIDQPGAISAAELRHQAAALDVRGARVVHVLAGRAYARAAAQVWPWARPELAGCPGIGYQLARLADLAGRPAPLTLFDLDALPAKVVG